MSKQVEVTDSTGQFVNLLYRTNPESIVQAPGC